MNIGVRYSTYLFTGKDVPRGTNPSLRKCDNVERTNEIDESISHIAFVLEVDPKIQKIVGSFVPDKSASLCNDYSSIVNQRLIDPLLQTLLRDLVLESGEMEIQQRLSCVHTGMFLIITVVRRSRPRAMAPNSTLLRESLTPKGVGEDDAELTQIEAQPALVLDIPLSDLLGQGECCDPGLSGYETDLRVFRGISSGDVPGVCLSSVIG